MKREFILFSLLPLMATAQQAEQDSLTVKELGDITIVADAQRASATKTIYIPTAKQKSTATGGIQLLARMNITQLSVNPMSETVTTVDNQPINIFINYQPATAEDVGGLNSEDVKRVEYLDFPTDPRFKRSEHVVNFITYSYAYGGYTKLYGKERFMVHSGEASVYTKFAYRRMEYDLILTGDYDYNSHIGAISDETFRFPGNTVGRESVTETGKYRQRSMYAAFRASWNRDENFSFRNLVSYRRINIPEQSSRGSVSFSSGFLSSTFQSESPSASNEIDWNSELYAGFSNGWDMNCNFNVILINNNSSDNYIAGNTLIENKANEKYWWVRGDLQINKKLSECFTAFTGLPAGGGRTTIVYNGTSNAINSFQAFFTAINPGVSMNYQKVAGSIDGGLAYESNLINGRRMETAYPFTHINLQYAPNQKNTMSLWFQYAMLSPDAKMKNPNKIQQSELLFVSGNPELKCSPHVSAYLSYSSLPSNQLQMTVYATFFKIFNRQIAVYGPMNEGMMLKKYMNDGDYNHGQFGAHVTCKLLGNKLALSLSPKLLLYKTTGSNSITYYPFTASLNADYYFGNFFMNVYCDSGSGYVDGETAYRRKMPPGYSLTAGWAAKGWNIQISAVNMFQSSWKLSDEEIESQWYRNQRIAYGADYHRRVSLTVTYTVNYGKKANSLQELESTGAINSFILH